MYHLSTLSHLSYIILDSFLFNLGGTSFMLRSHQTRSELGANEPFGFETFHNFEVILLTIDALAIIDCAYPLMKCTSCTCVLVYLYALVDEESVTQAWKCGFFNGYSSVNEAFEEGSLKKCILLAFIPLSSVSPRAYCPIHTTFPWSMLLLTCLLVFGYIIDCETSVSVSLNFTNEGTNKCRSPHLFPSDWHRL